MRNPLAAVTEQIDQHAQRLSADVQDATEAVTLALLLIGVIAIAALAVAVSK